MEAICRAIENGESEQMICRRVGVSDETLRRWKRDNVAFMARYKEAQKKYEEWFNRDLVTSCKRSLKSLILGVEYEETKTEYEQNPENPDEPRIKRQTVTTKRVLPNVTAIIFALTNRDPENWKNRQTNEITGNLKTESETKVDLSNVPDSVLDELAGYLDGGKEE